jgi:hypothetical protein
MVIIRKKKTTNTGEDTGEGERDPHTLSVGM